MTLHPADQAFYEWYHEHGLPAAAASIDTQRAAFLAGWNACNDQDTEV